jgi:hypothetical protein
MKNKILTGLLLEGGGVSRRRALGVIMPVR